MTSGPAKQDVGDRKHTHLGKIWWWVLPPAQVGQSPHSVPGRGETVRFNQQPEQNKFSPELKTS